MKIGDIGSTSSPAQPLDDKDAGGAGLDEVGDLIDTTGEEVLSIEDRSSEQ